MIRHAVRICIIASAVALCSAAHAEENAHKDLRSMPWLRDILNHGDDLGLSAEQKTKINEVADLPIPHSKAEWLKIRERIESIVTKEQREKIESMAKKREERTRAERMNAEDNDDHK